MCTSHFAFQTAGSQSQVRHPKRQVVIVRVKCDVILNTGQVCVTWWDFWLEVRYRPTWRDVKFDWKSGTHYRWCDIWLEVRYALHVMLFLTGSQVHVIWYLTWKSGTCDAIFHSCSGVNETGTVWFHWHKNIKVRLYKRQAHIVSGMTKTAKFILYWFHEAITFPLTWWKNGVCIWCVMWFLTVVKYAKWNKQAPGRFSQGRTCVGLRVRFTGWNKQVGCHTSGHKAGGGCEQAGCSHEERQKACLPLHCPLLRGTGCTPGRSDRYIFPPSDSVLRTLHWDYNKDSSVATASPVLQRSYSRSGNSVSI